MTKVEIARIPKCMNCQIRDELIPVYADKIVQLKKYFSHLSRKKILEYVRETTPEPKSITLRIDRANSILSARQGLQNQCTS